MKIIAPAPRGRSNIDENVAEGLEMWEARISKKRHSGVVSNINGTTTFIKSDDGREFLAWSRPELKVGTPVEFSKDQLQAVRVVRKETPPDAEHPVVVLAELPDPEPQPQSEVTMDPKIKVDQEIEDEVESLSSMEFAFRQQRDSR